MGSLLCLKVYADLERAGPTLHLLGADASRERLATQVAGRFLVLCPRSVLQAEIKGSKALYSSSKPQLFAHDPVRQVGAASISPTGTLGNCPGLRGVAS